MRRGTILAANRDLVAVSNLVVTNRSDPPSRQKAELIAAARLQIARRIARFCTSLAPAEFERLLDKMVNIHWKYDILPDLDPTTFDLDEQSDALEA